MARLPNRWATPALLATLALSSAWYVFKHVIQPNVGPRTALVDDVLAGRAEAPYQYRVLVPVLGRGLERLLPEAFGTQWRHGAAFGGLVLACFALAYVVFQAWLRRLFSPQAALLGTLLLALPVPLSVTGYFVDGDFVTLLAFAVGFWLMESGRDAWLPPLVVVEALNREQSAYLVVFYAVHLAARGRLRERRGLWILAASAAAFAAVYLGLRAWLGPRPHPYDLAFHLAHNTSLRNLREVIGPLWLSLVAGPVLLAGLAFRRTTRFFRLASLALVPYAVLFLLNGILIELAKFLPAFLVLIPMALQSLTGERPREPSGS